MVDETKSKRNLYLRRRHRKSETNKDKVLPIKPVNHQRAKAIPKPEPENVPKQSEPEQKPTELVSGLHRLEELSLKFTTFLIRHLKI